VYISLIYEGVLLQKTLTSVDVGVGRKYLEGVQTHRQPVFSPLLLCLSPVPIRSLRQFFFSSFFQMFEIVERVEQGLLAVADAVLPPSFFFIFVIFVSKSIVFLFVTLILSFPLFVLPHGHKKTQNSM